MREINQLSSISYANTKAMWNFKLKSVGIVREVLGCYIIFFVIHNYAKQGCTDCLFENMKLTELIINTNQENDFFYLMCHNVNLIM